MATFAEQFALLAASARQRTPYAGQKECLTSSGQWCSLCHARTLEYAVEIEVKNAALQKFWRDNGMGVPLAPLCASPLGRGYRTVSKRKIFQQKKGMTLGLIPPSDSATSTALDVLACAIEPAPHAAIYAFLAPYLNRPHVRPLAEELTYVVIKGSYESFAVVFNVREISPPLVKSVNTVSKALTHTFPHVSGVFLYVDPSGGNYYMGGPDGSGKSQKIFGKGTLTLTVGGRSFVYDILSFSQVNHAMAESLVNAVRSLLAPDRRATLFDLYSGYGLFGLSFAADVHRVVGLERSLSSHAAALRNRERQHAENVRFHRVDVTADTLVKHLREARETDCVILDPPRNGTAEGVIETVAHRGMRNVVHLLCNIDIAQQEISRWIQSGYVPVRAVPLDMFPGTNAVELAVHFTSSKGMSRIA